MLYGIDAAYYEPVIDWKKLLQQGYKFSFIKCSQSLFKDPKFDEHWHNAKSAGMPRGAYHFYSPIYLSATPEKQSEYFFESLNGDLGELPFVVDLEKYTAGYYHGAEFWYRYLERLNALSGKHPIIIYTAFYYFNDNVKIHPVQDVTYFGRYPLWIANYGVSKPLIPYPWTNWLFWQHTESQIIDGVYDELGRLTECDVDLFNGNEEDFHAILLKEPNIPNGEPTMAKNKVTITFDQGARERQEPHAAGVYRNILADNTVHYSDFDPVPDMDDPTNPDKEWIKLQSGWYIATRYPSSSGIVQRAIVDPVPISTTHTVDVYIDGILEFHKEF